MTNKIIAEFPSICNGELFMEIENENNYNVLVVSIFDHWLSVEEAETQSVFYDEENILMLSKYLEYENIFLKCFSELYSKYELFYVDSVHNKETDCNISKAENEDLFLSICKSSLREQSFFNLLIPQKRSILIGNYDLTIVILTIKDAVEYQKEMCDLFRKNGLYILPKNQY
jgi:hypothetical protein